MIDVKICTVLCLYIAACGGEIPGMTDEMKEVIETLHNNCKADSGVDESAIVAAQNANFDMNNEKLKCYAFCLMMEMGVISDEGVVDPDAIVGIMPEEVVKIIGPAIHKCGSPSGATPCESALLAFKCYADSDPKNFFFP